MSELLGVIEDLKAKLRLADDVLSAKERVIREQKATILELRSTVGELLEELDLSVEEIGERGWS